MQSITLRQLRDTRQVKAWLKAGVQIAVAPQLFPTPPDLAARMVELAGIGHYPQIEVPDEFTAGAVELLELS